MPAVDAYAALSHLKFYHGLTFPYDNHPLDKPGGSYEITTEAEWDAITWQPPQHWVDYPHFVNPSRRGTNYTPDPNASPKPSWAMIVKASADAEAYQAASYLRFRTGQVLEGLSTDTASKAVAHDSSGKVIHIGAGISQMTAIVDALAAHERAGRPWHRIVLRSADHTETVTLWNPHDARTFLDSVATQKNFAEGARNIVHTKTTALLATLQDSATSTEDRATAKAALEELLADIDTHYAAALEEAKRRVIPDNLPQAVTHFSISLEAAATRRMAYIIDATDQPGADLHPACTEQEVTLAAITAAKTAGQRALRRVEAIEGLEAVHDAAIAAIEAVEVDNVPIWRGHDGSALTFQLDGSLLAEVDHQAGERPALIFRAVNPAGEDFGDVSVELLPGSDLGGWVYSGALVTEDGSAHSARFAWTTTGGTPPAVATARLLARNGCGPAFLRLEIVNTAI